MSRGPSRPSVFYRALLRVTYTIGKSLGIRNAVPPTPSVEEEILDLFHALMRHVAESHAPEFLGVDVTMSQAKALYLLSVRPGASMSSIAAELGVGASAVSGLIDRLVALGYVERKEDVVDRRQQLVTITDTGTAALDHMRELRAQVTLRLLKGLDHDELEAFRTSLIALSREVQRLDHSDSPEASPERTVQ
jgi:DNA-binding MarR family transcriptional regulator